MSERERLIELIHKCDIMSIPTDKFTEGLADYLLENGVFITPVTEGDGVYITLLDRVLPCDVISVSLYRKILIYKAQHGLHLSYTFKTDDIGKTVFLTREEAEKALAERDSKE